MNPIDKRRQERSTKKQSVPSFGAFADRYIDTHSSSWRITKHVEQWRMTLTAYAGQGDGIWARCSAKPHFALLPIPPEDEEPLLRATG